MNFNFYSILEFRNSLQKAQTLETMEELLYVPTEISYFLSSAFISLYL